MLFSNLCWGFSLCFFFSFSISFCVQDGRSALHTAAYKDFGEVAKILIEHGSNFHLQDKVFIFSFFLFGWCDCFILILFYFLTFLFIFKNGWTPLHIAASHGFEEIVKIFVLHGANVNIQNKVFFFSQ